MGANAFQYDVRLNLSADTKLARTQIESLQSQLKSISNLNLNFNGIDQLTSKVNEASDAALKLQTHLAAALNPDTGNLDFSKFNNSILRSGDSIENLSYSLLKAGSSGTKAFVSLADSISRSEIPLLRTSKLVNGLYDNLKKAAGWQISSSVIHGVMGQYQQAIGYAKALDKSLTDIRIVTGQSADQMARFAKEANAAAKKLSTTTVDYTDASLIYYQQGLSDAEVKKRSDITIKMANATGVSAAKVSDQLTSIWNNFDNGTKSLEYYADVMTALGAATASSTDEIAKGVQKFAAISDTVGLSYEYATSALATITATTRESADTVGNSLKTLFSRIQGLQLGDTLDDGTTLNKYSTALAKVGISIKNANGELKSMDTLLNEMGTKWSTLAEDQQMALAQTVGGARQYTQIMTLMENWDFFKENLTTAKTATGTLTQQAEIYADSWEAAQKRFKASQESLYDTLINSNSFKKILNIGSTIVEGISNALSGTNGLPGLLGTIGPILGMTFKKQLGESLSSTLYNIGSLIPGVRKGIENARQVQLTNMLHSIRDAEVTPDLGKYERDTTASIIERQYAEREQKEKYRAKMSGASEALDVEYEKLLKNIDQQQLDLSRQQDEAELNAEYAADALRNEKYNKRNISSELTDSFGRVLVTDSQLGQDNDIAHALKLVGAREGQAEIAVDQLVQKMTADKSNAYNLKTLKGDMADIYGSLIGASDHEIAKLKSGTGITTDREKALKSQFDKLMDDYRAVEKEMFNQYGDNPRAFASELPDILRMTMEDYEKRVLTSLGFMEDGVAVGEQTNAKDILSNSSRAAVLKREQEKRGQTRQEVVGKREELWAQSGPSLAESVVGIGSGIGATYGAIQSAYGTFNSIKDGNWGGALTGLIATGYNMTSGMGDLTQSFQDLGRHGKALKNRPDIQKYNLLQQQQELQLKQSQVNELDKGIEQDKKRLDYLLQSKALNEQEQTDLNNLEKKAKEGKLQSKADKNRLEGLRDKQERYINNFLPEVKNLQLGITSQEAKKDEIGFNPETLKKVSKDLEKLDDVTAGKFSGAINKVGDGLEFVSKHADKFTIGLQAAQIAMTATAKINEYFYNEETRQAQKAATTANELANAHQTAQNNYNLLLNSIEEYNTKTNELADSNLKGAAKQAAIYDQNQAALNLIDKYNITDFKYIGDKIQISEDALEKAQEESIQAMSTAKYASGLANLSAKKEANDVIEEALERDLVYDESFQQGAGVLLAGASGAAIGATIGSVVPVIGTAIGGIVGGIAGTLVGAVNAAWADDIGERKRENSYVDKAIAKTRETGSTSWMDDYAGDEFSANELKKLKENRSAIKQQAASEAAYEQAELAQRESIANDILANNDRTEKFKYADRLLDGLASEVKNWEELGDTYGEWYESEKTRINAAKNIQSELGLSGNVMWEDNKANKMLTYTTEDGQTGTLSYDALSKMEGVKKGKAESDAYIEQMMSIYDNIKTYSTETTAAGMLSFLSSGNFDNATIEETKQAQEYMQKILAQTNGAYNYEEIAKALNLDTTNGAQAALQKYALEQGYAKDIKDEYGNVISQVGDIGAYLNTWQNAINWTSGAETNLNQLDYYTSWKKDKGSDIVDSMTQSTMGTLYNKLTQIQAIGGDVAASNFLDNLTYLLEESGIGEKNYNAAMESLMALDWSSSNIEAQISDIIESFNGELNMSSEELKNFADILSSTSLAIPDFETEINNLSQLFGTVSKLKIGDSVNEDLLTQLESIGVDLSAYAMKQWDGSYKLLEDPETVQEQIHEKLLDTFDQSQAYADIYEKYLGEDSLYKSVGLTSSDFQDITLEDLNSWFGMAKDSRYYSPGSDVYGKVAYLEELGINQQGIEDLYKKQEEAAEIVNKYKVENGQVVGIYDTDTNKDGVIDQNDTASEFKDNAAQIAAQTEYNTASAQYSAAYQAGQAIISSIENHATKDWSDLTKEERQQVASTYNTLDKFEAAKNDGRGIIYDADGNLTEEGQEQLTNLALQYPELTEYVEAYNNALASENETAIENAETTMKKAIAMQEALAAYTALTGKKIDLAKLQDTMDKLREDMGEDGVAYSGTDEELADLAAQVLAAADAYGQLSKNSAQWIANLGEDSYKAKEAAQNLGKYLEIVLGLNDLEGITPTDWIEVIETAEEKLKDVGGLSAVIRGDRRAGLEFGELLARRANGGTLEQAIQQQKGANDETSKLEEAIDTMQSWFVDNGIEGFSDLGGLNEEQQAAFKKNNEEIWNESGGDWETYQAATEAAGYTVSRQDFLKGGTYTDGGKTYYTQYEYKNLGNGNSGWVNTSNNEVLTDTQVSDAGLGNPLGEGQGNASVNSAGQYYRRTGGGGGGGGGPTKVQVKSAQELMTRYKTTDQKLTNNEMQKTAALQAKDLLYGKSKINQLEKINTLLRKQQQLTADRIEEELDYLESDKEKIIEVLERYNKDAKDEDKISIEFDSQGLISNYKQVIGAWAEELASYYLDGELTAEEGKKAEELQKKIQDFNTLIKDYEDSLNQLASSIEQYETTLYEMLSNDIEAMAHNIEYQIDINNDDISYLDFYMTNIKDSIGSVIDYLELLGSKVSESASQIGIYEQGYVDLVDFINENPLQLWATQGVEGMLTAEQVTTLRSYRDGLMSVYQTALSVRKEIEDQTLKVFDYWNNKIDKNVESISRFTDMLSQFKDIINIVGKDAMGLSNTFMKTFEQQSIDQSFDNIAVNRTQYEHLIQVYEDAQEKLETARASGNERDIEYWEKVVDETQEAMEGAQDALLTTLQHSLNAIAEQFTNAVTIALEEFEENIYKFNGLDGMIADYEQIKEKQDLMVADYEKIYSLNKLNRDLEKTLNNSNILAGKSKLLEFQQKINKINESNVELSQYELEYLQAEYDLKVAEMELENARNSKDTVMLSKDSEGNWSYVYTQNANAVEDAEQRVEDALYKMQQLSYEYTDEMSQAMMSISQQMRDEISALSIQDFASAEEYYNEISRIQDKYSEQLAHREDELNKAISNNAALYEEDWANYSAATGYKISADSEWIDSFKETTLGGLIGSGSDISNFSTLITQSTNEMNEALGKAASTYFVNADKALNTYGSSLKGFGATVSTTTSNIINSSKNATKEVTSLANTLVDKFAEISDTVESELAEWTEEIGNKLEELLETIKEINKLIADSASKELPDTNEIIGQEEAVQRLQSAEFENKDFNNWTWSEEGQVAAYGDKGLNLVEFNAELVQKVNDALQAYANTPTTDTEERAKKLEELNKLIKDYWTFKRILEKIYDPTNIKIEDLEVPDTGAATQMATGGYTGEWGNEGKWAVLHEKELVLSADDTANFLDALSVSRDLVNSMIEMNAQASSLGLGNMVASSIQDTPQTIEQQVSITADFPNATDKDEIMEAFDNLINTASQYANRYKL